MGNKIKGFDKFELTDEQEEVIDYLKKLGVEFKAFSVDIESNKYKDFVDGDYIVTIQPEKGFDQSFDIDPFLPDSIKGKLEEYVECVWTYNGDKKFLKSELEKSPFFKTKGKK